MEGRRVKISAAGRLLVPKAETRTPAAATAACGERAFPHRPASVACPRASTGTWVAQGSTDVRNVPAAGRRGAALCRPGRETRVGSPPPRAPRAPRPGRALRSPSAAGRSPAVWRGERPGPAHAPAPAAAGVPRPRACAAGGQGEVGAGAGSPALAVPAPSPSWDASKPSPLPSLLFQMPRAREPR